MIVTIQPLIPLHAVFELKLQFGIVWGELQADFVHQLRRQSQVGPSLKKLVFLMLELVLSTFVELHHLCSHIGGVALVSAIFNCLLVKIIG